jgi:nucleoid-associated protein YgaU
MARSKVKKGKSTSVKVVKPDSSSTKNYLNFDMSDRRSLVNLVLGTLVVLALGLLLFNYFTKNNLNQGDLGPSQQIENTQTQIGDVSKEKLPGKYTVKEGDTLFSIAEKYYTDGYKYSELVKVNKLSDANNLPVGLVLDIPKLDTNALTKASPASDPSLDFVDDSLENNSNQNINTGSGGAVNQTIWGEKITANTYTVQQGDWLSKISGRAYGDVMSFQKIAQANNISNPDLIEVGMILKIPR